jgi:hypothetical protein
MRRGAEENNWIHERGNNGIMGKIIQRESLYALFLLWPNKQELK